MNRRNLATVLVAASMLGACATATTPEQRTRLTKAEIGTMKPEIVAHRRCMAGKVVSYLGSGTTLSTMIDTAKSGCRGKLVPIVARLKEFNLTRNARARYLRAVETTAANAVKDGVLKASAKARRNGQGARETML